MSVRLQCVLTIQKILEEKVFFSTLKDCFKPNDKAFANFLVLTALRRKPVIDKLLNTLLSKKIPNKNKVLTYVLLLGSVELLYAQTPDYAVINEYVSIAKKLGDVFSARMVNAVLRKVALKKAETQDACAFPESFKQILKQDYSDKQIKQMACMLCIEAPLDLTTKESPETWAQKLGGILFENGTIRLSNIKTNIESIDGFHEGCWWVQDLAASLPVGFIKNLKNKKALDLCAAPGGKTAQLLANGAIVTAVDISAERLATLEENMARLNFEQNLSVICADGLTYLQNTKNMFDFILLDAPCSATGTFRKHPEVIYFKTVNDIKKQVPVQQKLLFEAAKHLAKGGTLIYATCSLSKAEGEDQIQKFLAEHHNFELLEISPSLVSKYTAQKLDENMFDKKVLRTLPYHHKKSGGTDGFFAAALKRIK